MRRLIVVTARCSPSSSTRAWRGLTQSPAVQEDGNELLGRRVSCSSTTSASPRTVCSARPRTAESRTAKSSAKESFAAERIGIASLSLGIINECHRLSIEYAKSRKLWGREIGQFQLIQLKLAEMEVARINVQNMVFNAIERTAAGDKVEPGGGVGDEAVLLARSGPRSRWKPCSCSVENGYMAEYRVEQLARDAKSLMIYAGSNEIQVTHIAKGLLG